MTRPSPHRRRSMSTAGWVVGIIALAALVYLVVGKLAETDRADTATVTAKTLGDQVKDACARGDVSVADLCRRAAEVAAAPAPAAPDPVAVRQAARDAVASYCAARNQCRGANGATPDFDAIVTAVVNSIPRPTNGTDGKQGPGPTDAQVSSAVADYCDAHNQCQGRPGTNGENGQSPPCMSEPSQCRGPDGQPPAGWTTSYPDGSTGSCTRAADFDPATPRYTCTRSAPPSSTTDPPTIGG